MSFKDASRFGSDALRRFTWREYTPFFWMLALEGLFLFLSFNLGAPWGMATAGALATSVAGAGATHYPGFFIVLPAVFTYLDIGIYTFLGAALIPLALTRILPPRGSRSGATTVASRVRGAYLPTLISLLIVLGILYVWEQIGPKAIAPLVRAIIPADFLEPPITWLIGTLVGLVVSTLALYVPIVAVREGGGLGAIGRGVSDGARMLPTTYLIVLFYSAVPLLITALIQTSGSALVARLRPEILSWLLLVYAVLMSLANYLIYAAAARWHAAEVKEEA